MHLYRLFIMVFGVFACSTAVIMIKISTLHPVLLAACRLLAASAILFPVWLRSYRRQRGTPQRKVLPRTVLPAAMLGLHFITWIIGARLTLAANASLIVNLVPVAMPFLTGISTCPAFCSWPVP